MTYIRTIPPEEAEGQLKELYDGDFKNLGFVPEYSKAVSLRPEVLANWRTLLGSIRKHMRLRRYELVTMAAAVEMRCAP